MLPLKITASLLLLIQAFHLACLQNSTDTPGRTIDQSWLRQLPRNEVEGEHTTSSGQSEFDQVTDEMTEFSNDLSSGTASGFMAEEENMTTQDKSANQTFGDPTDFSTIKPSAFANETTEEPELPDAVISPRNVTAESTNSGQINMNGTEEEFNPTMRADNTTTVGDVSDNTNVQSTTTMENPTTTTTPNEEEALKNATENTDTSATTTAAPDIYRSTTITTAEPEIYRSTTITTAEPEIYKSTSMTTTEPEIYRSTTKSSTATAPPSETTQTSPVTTTTAVPNTPDSTNKTGKIAGPLDRGSVVDPDSAADPYRSKRNVAWLAVLGTAAATAVVGLVAYIILKKKHQKAFTHRKLVEEYPSDPVLRLDNGEPLDLNYGGSAYYNPALQSDSIQMTDIPGRRLN